MTNTSNHFSNIEGIDDPNASWANLSQKDHLTVMSQSAQMIASPDMQVRSEGLETLSHIDNVYAKQWVKGRSFAIQASRILGQKPKSLLKKVEAKFYKVLAFWQGGPTVLCNSDIASARALR